jgi:3-deoxy-D-manno-octulosonate 8-phosphate phosphatase (KDO 8-P phosphatase)
MTYVVSDVDGVLNTGQFLYSSAGKEYKVFGPHDSDGVKLLREAGIDVQFISADHRGFNITKSRLDDMGAKLTFVSENNRLAFLLSVLDLGRTWFIGDGFYDAVAAASICTHSNYIESLTHNDAVDHMKALALILPGTPGNGFFFNAAMHILKIEEKYDFVLSKFGGRL